MAQRAITIEELEALAAWHRATAEHAGSDWVWEARLRTAEDLERQAAELRAQRSSNKDRNGVRGVPGDQLPRRRARPLQDDAGGAKTSTQGRP
ncbi:MAG TPA: hypothetical protein VME41_17280 [Stellaceae bacterium]|nr:hypothetical protein [Stellaceae bacterium]